MTIEEQFLEAVKSLQLVPGFPKEATSWAWLARELQTWTGGDIEKARAVTDAVVRTFNHWDGVSTMEDVFLAQERKRREAAKAAGK